MSIHLICPSCSKQFSGLGDKLQVAKIQTCNFCFHEFEIKKEHFATSVQTTPESISAEAERIIAGSKREEYGPAKDSFENIADTWTAHLRQRQLLRPQHKLRGQDVAIMMAAFKLLRESAQGKRDNLVDAVGYILLADQVK